MKHALLVIAVALSLSGCEGSYLRSDIDAFFGDDPQNSYSSSYSGSSSNYYLISPPASDSRTGQSTIQTYSPEMGIIISPPASDSRTGQSTIQYWY